MLKKLVVLGIALVMVFSLGACCDNELAEYKTTAITDLTDYAAAKGESNYSEENWAVIRQIVADGKETIDAAATKPAVDTARDATKAEIDTIESTLAEYRMAAIQELENFVNDLVDRDRYTRANLEKIEGYVESGMEAINKAESKTAVDAALNTAEENILAVPQNEGENMLNEEAISLIKQSAASVIQVPVDEIFFYYYGTINGNVVLMLLPDLGGREAWNDIFEIYYPNTNFIRVWSNGSFYSLTESRDQGLLTTSDLAQIAETHEREFDNIYYDKETWI